MGATMNGAESSPSKHAAEWERAVVSGHRALGFVAVMFGLLASALAVAPSPNLELEAMGGLSPMAARATAVAVSVTAFIFMWLNFAAANWIGQRRCRSTMLIIAAMNALCLPVGTAFAAFAVAFLYAPKIRAQFDTSQHRA